MQDPQGRYRVDGLELFAGSATTVRTTANSRCPITLTHTPANSPELLIYDGSFTGQRFAGAVRLGPVRRLEQSLPCRGGTA